MENLITVFFIVLIGVILVPAVIYAYGDGNKQEPCRSHKWEEVNNQLVCSVCKYKAHS